VKFRTIDLTYDSPIRYKFRAINQFGYKEITYNMPPVSYYDTGNTHIVSELNTAPVRSNPAVFELYTVSGVYILQTANKSEFFNGTVNPGIYILKGKDAAGNILFVDKINISK
jgi:hypothetical protein